MTNKLLDIKPELRENLFIRGFLITSNNEVMNHKEEYPFYNNWNFTQVDDYVIATHNKVNMYKFKNKEKTFFLIGHAYNPFTMETDEVKILEKIALAYDENINTYYDAIDEITGLFIFGYIESNNISYIIDPSGLQSGCYGKIKNSFYISSHAQLIGDLCDLEMDVFVKELINYKWYGRVMGPYLPADLSPFKEVKRIVPNIDFIYKNDKVSHDRFFPRKEQSECKNQQEYDKVIKYAADIMKNNMELITKKWDRPQISLTGGIDSNTTFAAANGNYDKYETFSYLSAPKEVPDVDAAKVISERFNVKHTVYEVPETDENIDDYEEYVKILRHNNGYVADGVPNELRKRCILKKECTADVEVKSWGSETIRAYWYKHYGRKSMPKSSPKLYRNLYKIFLANRSLASKVDKVFKKYLEEFQYDQIPNIYLPADMHYWEVTWGSWGSVNVSEMKFCFDITIAYNNRKFLDALFKVPLEKRISDEHHLDMKKYLNKELYDMNIRVVNMKETNTRAFLLNLPFVANSILPF